MFFMCVAVLIPNQQYQQYALAPSHHSSIPVHAGPGNLSREHKSPAGEQKHQRRNPDGQGETFTVTYVCSNSLAFSEKRKNGF